MEKKEQLLVIQPASELKFRGEFRVGGYSLLLLFLLPISIWGLIRFLVVGVVVLVCAINGTIDGNMHSFGLNNNIHNKHDSQQDKNTLLLIKNDVVKQRDVIIDLPLIGKRFFSFNLPIYRFPLKMLKVFFLFIPIYDV